MDKKITVPINPCGPNSAANCNCPEFSAIDSRCLECKVFENKCLQDRFFASFELAPIGIVHTDLNGRFMSVNRKFCELVGYSRNELMTMSFGGITRKEDLHLDLQAKDRMISGELDSDCKEKRYVHKKGHLVWVNRTVSVVRDEAGNPVYFIALCLAF